MQLGVVLGFDVGERKLGVAIGNSVSGDARALCILERDSTSALFERLGVLINEWQPDQLVVGRPLNDQGEPQPATALAERFARQLAGRLSLPVAMVDERYSSVAAQSWRREHARGQGGKQRKRAAIHDDDALAAAIIVQQYLDAHDDP